jgi:hypothetical protein
MQLARDPHKLTASQRLILAEKQERDYYLLHKGKLGQDVPFPRLQLPSLKLPVL